MHPPSPDHLAAAVELRQGLHQHPEVSGCERETADRVVRFLGRSSPDEIVTGLGGHGVAAVFDGGAPGPTVLLRCELDALPIEERSGVSYRSVAPGRGHLCGHDGHMATLAAVALALGEHRPARGRAVLFFQPAEETGAGAAAVIADPRFEPLRPDAAFALHNLPGRPLHEIGLRAGAFCCASQGLRITLRGRSSHAAHPEDGLSPGPAVARLLTSLSTISDEPVVGGGFALATVSHARLGPEAFGVSPGEAVILVTLRSETDAGVAELRARCVEAATAAAQTHGLGFDFSDAEVFAATVNDPGAIRSVRAAAEAERLPVHEFSAVMRWSEDFGRFGTICPSALFTLGSGETQPQLHSPDFDYPDALIKTGARVFLRLIRDQLDA